MDGLGVVDLALREDASGLALTIVNLTNPMMLKGPVREVLPLGAAAGLDRRAAGPVGGQGGAAGGRTAGAGDAAGRPGRDRGAVDRPAGGRAPDLGLRGGDGCSATSLKRILAMVPTLFGMSLISFLIIQLPPGDYLTSLLSSSMPTTARRSTRRRSSGCEAQYGLRPALLRPVLEVDVGHPVPRRFRLFLRVEPAGRRADLGPRWGRPWRSRWLSLVFVWAVSLPIGIYSAVRRHSVGDHVFTFLGFLGLAMPNFILALTLMYLCLPLSRAERRRAVLAGIRRRAVELGRRPGTCSPICGSRS